MASSSPSAVSTADLSARLQSWLFESNMFEDMVQWARGSARAAAVPADALSSRGEMRLAYTALHAEFEAFFDSKLEKFCLDAGATAEQVHAQLAAAMAAGDGASGSASELVNYITALADFDGASTPTPTSFRRHRRRRRRRRRSGRVSLMTARALRVQHLPARRLTFLAPCSPSLIARSQSLCR